MFEKIYDYCIVGSGPTAVAAIAKLPLDSKILVIDRGQEAKKTTINLKEGLKAQNIDEWKLDSFFESPEHFKGFEFKPYFGDSYTYKLEAKLKFFAPESQSFGGFSKIWGATVFPYLNRDLNEIMRVHEIEFEDEFSIIDQILNPVSDYGFINIIKQKELNFPSTVTEVNRDTSYHKGNILLNFTNTLVVPGVVAINYPRPGENSSGCNKCGICQIGCPFDYIWSSDNYLQNNFSNIEYIRGEMIYSAKNLDNTETLSYLQGTKTFTVKCRKLLLCGGALGNARILMRIFETIDEIIIKDNQTRVIAGLTYHESLAKIKDSLAEFFIFDRNKNDRVITQGQFYTNSRYLRARIMSEYPALSKVPKVLFDFFINHFFSALIYHSEDASGQIVFGNKKNINYKSRFFVFNRMKNSYRNFRISVILFFQGYLVIPFVGRNLNVGGGGHIGSLEVKNWSKNERDLFFKTGKIDSTRDIYVLGPASLPVLIPGPVTYMGMVNTVRQISWII